MAKPKPKPWILKVTNTVPFSNRAAYEEFLQAAFATPGTTTRAYPDKKQKKKRASDMLANNPSMSRLPDLQRKPSGSTVPDVEHIGSYRTVIGNVLEYTHLIRLKNVGVLNTNMPVCAALIEVYDFEGDDLVSDSRYELLKSVV